MRRLCILLSAFALFDSCTPVFAEGSAGHESVPALCQVAAEGTGGGVLRGEGGMKVRVKSGYRMDLSEIQRFDHLRLDDGRVAEVLYIMKESGQAPPRSAPVFEMDLAGAWVTVGIAASVVGSLTLVNSDLTTHLYWAAGIFGAVESVPVITALVNLARPPVAPITYTLYLGKPYLDCGNPSGGSCAVASFE